MGKDKTKPEKPKETESEVKTEKKTRAKRKSSVPDNFTEENVLAKMRELGGKNVTSTQIKDAFGLSNESGRGTTRRMMKKLEKNKKVKIHLKEGKRRQYLYDVANPGHIVYDPTKERALRRR